MPHGVILLHLLGSAKYSIKNIQLSIYDKKEPVFHECRPLLDIIITVQK